MSHWRYSIKSSIKNNETYNNERKEQVFASRSKFQIKRFRQAEAEVVPSSSLVEVEVEVEVEVKVGVEVEVGVRLRLMLRLMQL